MPTICMFLGIIIRMYTEAGGKHSLPHFHAEYAGIEATFNFSGEVIAGTFPPRQTSLVKAWALLHTEELEANWQIISNGESAFRIDPLR